jgi:hypothetical protein
MTPLHQSARSVARLAARVPIVAWFGLPALFVLIFARYAHEPWGDEVQAYLLAHHNGWGDLLALLRLEGVAPLFHVSLKVLDMLLPARWVLPVAAALGYWILLGGTWRLLRAFGVRGGLALAFTLALAASGTYAYELGVIARQYGASLGFAFASGAVFASDPSPRGVVRGVALAALSLLLSVHAGCIATGIALVFLLRHLRRSPHAAGLGFVMLLSAAAVVVHFIRPSAERTTYLTQFHLPRGEELLLKPLDALQSGFGASGWWPLANRERWKTLVWAPTLLAAGLVLHGGLARHPARQTLRYILVGLGLGNLALLVILVCFHYGAYRHHLSLVVPSLVVMFGALGVDGALSKRRQMLAFCLMCPWLVHELRVSCNDLLRDRRGVFAEATLAQEVLPEHAHVVADTDDMVAIGLLLGRDDIKLRGARNNGGVTIRHTIPNRARFDTADPQRLLREACAEASDRTFLLTEPGAKLLLPVRCLHPTDFLGDRPSLGLQPLRVAKVQCSCVNAEEQPSATRAQ